MKRLPLLALCSFVAVCFGFSVGHAQDEAGVFTKFDKNPVPTRTPPPQYPDSVKGENGIVAVLVVIDEKGAVTQAVVTKSTNPAFEQPSLDAIVKWKFKPAEVGGQPVKAKVTIPLHFNADS